MLWYRDENILVPQAVAGTCGREVVWRLPTSSRIRQMLTNPAYAGVLAYGRTATRTVVEQGRARQAGRRRKPRDQWKVLILDNHAGYIELGGFSIASADVGGELVDARGADRRSGQKRRCAVVRAAALWAVRPANVRGLQRQRG